MRNWTWSATAICVLLSGCGTRLVFVRYQDDLKAETAPPSVCTGTSDSTLTEADSALAALLRSFHLPTVSPRMSKSDLAATVQQKRDEMRRMLYERAQHYRRAETCYRAAVEMDPSISYAYVGLAAANISMGDTSYVGADREDFYTRAQNALARARELNPADGQVLYYQSELLVRRGSLEQAEKILQELIDKKWERANVRNLLGWIFSKTNRQPEAVQQWEAASRLDTPAESTEWAIRRLRPAARVKFNDPADEEEPDGVYRWNAAISEPEPIAKPEHPCGWGSNGTPRC